METLVKDTFFTFCRKTVAEDT